MPRPPVLPDATLLQAVARLGEVGLDALRARFPDTPVRTLQRRLAALVARGDLAVSGKARATRYRIADSGVSGTIELSGFGLSLDFPVSPESAPLLQRVMQPLARREPVGYERSLLEDYVPNATHYLPRPLRDRLREMGTSPVAGSAAGTYARQILDRLLIDLSWASSQLEGNTYSRLDTENLLRFNLEAIGKDALETQMILNHKRAIELLVEDAPELGFNRHTVTSLHALLSENLLPEPGAGGRLRTTPVGITGSTYTPSAIPALIEECFDTFLAKAAAIEDPFEQALFSMVHLPYLQPFDDVNKRTSRLVANLPLIKRNLSPLAFIGLPRETYVLANLAVYELRRIELLRDVFAWAYERSCRQYTILRDSLPEPDPVRLRNREVLGRLVQEVVEKGIRRDDVSALSGLVAKRGENETHPVLIALLRNELHHLHAGNFARYRILPSRFSEWLENQQ